jgi:hypothetical protein
MSLLWILLPLFVEVALTFVLMFWLGVERVAVVRRRDVHIRDIALRQPNWPLRATQVSNAFDNQFQLPLLFYVLVILAIFTGRASPVFVVLAWLFVAARIGHAVIHVTHNNVPRRFWWYAAGAITLALMWLIFAIQVLLGL